MGLDMYLDKVKKVKEVPFNVLRNIDDIEELKEKDIELYNKIKHIIVKRGSVHYSWNSIFEEVGYWRKANSIHNWFVINVQDGTDNWLYYEVSKEDIKELLDVCNKVINSLEKSKYASEIEFDTFENKEYEYKIFFNTKIAEKYLPTVRGCFFGGIDYDSYYLDKVIYTKELCEKILKEFDWDNYHLCYSASW